MDNLKILSFTENFKLSKEQQFNIRLHDHGLLRLIPLSVDHQLFDVTDKVFFHTLINSLAYQEMFFDHFSQKSDNKHGPFLLETIKENNFIKISNDHLREEIVQIVSSPKWSCPPISKEKPVSYTHLRAHETKANLVCRLLLEKIWSELIPKAVSYTHLTLPTICSV